MEGKERMEELVFLKNTDKEIQTNDIFLFRLKHHTALDFRKFLQRKKDFVILRLM